MAEKKDSTLGTIAKVGGAILGGGIALDKIGDTVKSVANSGKTLELMKQYASAKSREAAAKQGQRAARRAVKGWGKDEAAYAKASAERKAAAAEAKALKKMIKKLNHPEWYGKYPEYITSNLNWGIRKQFDHFPTAVGLRIGITPTIPTTKGKVSQSYIDAIRAIYAKVRGSNTGAFNYDVEDLAAYIEYVKNIVMLHTTLVRDIKGVNNVDPYLAQSPDGLLSVLGYDDASIRDMRGNAVTYITRLNQLANSIQVTMPIPPDMTAIDRAKFIASAVFEEGKGPKSAILAYTLDYIMTLDISNTETSTNKLNYDKLSGVSFKDKITLLQAMINEFGDYSSPSYGGPTFDRIAGDLLKAYGENAFTVCDRVSIDDKIEIFYDEYSLNQIQNLTLAGLKPLVNEGAQKGTTPFKWSVQLLINVPGSSDTSMKPSALPGVHSDNDNTYGVMPITTNKKDITGLEAISLTRLCAEIHATFPNNQILGDEDNEVTLYNCGTEFASSLNYVYYNSDNNLAVQQVNVIDTAYPAVNNSQILTAMWGQVDYSPSIYYVQTGTKYAQPLLDLDTYTFLEESQLESFNDAATLSLYKTIDINDQVNFRATKK